MSLYTCISCRVAFATPELQKAHHKTDWHRYNLKRKVAELPPVTAADFHQRVLERKAQLAEDEKKQDAYCQLCKKQFSTQKAFENHEQSKKHREAASKVTEDMVEKNNRKNLAMNDTAVKGGKFEADQKEVKKNLANLKIMNKESLGAEKEQKATGKKSAQPKPSTSSKQTEDDSDSDSWESVEGEALPIEECLFCSYQSKSLEKNMKHMTVEHSFFVPDAEYLVDLEGLISYLGEKVGEGNMCLWCGEMGKAFYTTRAAQQHMMDKGHCKMLHEGEALLEYEDFYDYRSSYPDYKEKPTGKDEDEEDVDIEQLVVDGYELVLPSGATVGHRSLKIYYKQNLPQRRVGRSNAALPRILAQYKALGWTGTTTVAAKQKAKDISYMRQLRSRRDLHLSMKANKLQPHFRPQVIF